MPARPRLLAAAALGLLLPLPFAPPAVADDTAGKVKGSIDAITTTFCDLSARTGLEVAITNRGSDEMWVRLYGPTTDDLRSGAVLVAAGDRVTASAWLEDGDTGLRLYALAGDGGTPPTKLLDKEARPADLDCAAPDPSAEIGDLDPATCTYTTKIDNSRSSGRLQFRVGTANPRVVDAGTVARVRSALAWTGTVEDVTERPTASVAAAASRVVDEASDPVASRDVLVGCDQPVAAYGDAGMIAFPTGAATLSARVVVPGLERCSAREPGYRLFARLNGTEDSAEAVEVTGRCDGRTAVYTASAGVGADQEVITVAAGAQLDIALDGDGVVVRDETTGATASAEADLAGATAVAIFHQAAARRSVDHAVTDVVVSGTPLADVDDVLFFHATRVLGAGGESPIWVVPSVAEGSFAFRSTKP